MPVRSVSTKLNLASLAAPAPEDYILGANDTLEVSIKRDRLVPGRVATSITTTTIPIDVVIYGNNGNADLIDETGSVGAIDVADAPLDQSITFDGTNWSVTPTLTPGFGMLSAVPEPGTFGALTLLASLGLVRRRK